MRARAPRILLTADTVGGVWTFAQALSQTLVAAGWEVMLAAMGGGLSHGQRQEAAASDRIHIRDSDFRLEWMEQPWDDLQGAGTWLLELQRDFRADVVHLNHFAHTHLPWGAPTVVVGHSCVVSWWLGLRAKVHGVPYPGHALAALRQARIAYGGWVANHRAPEVFASARVTVHVPRGPYARALPGIPTIRVFEALACGIPLVSAPWDDTEKLFRPGQDYLVAADGAAMRQCLHTVLHEPELAAALAQAGQETIRERHTCAHRVDELLRIHSPLRRATGGALEHGKE